jgi:DNA polymerase-3 subunit alpha
VSNPGFVHLRLRSEYSISDSIVRIDDALAAAAADQQPALALTDSGNLFGWVKFYRAAIARGIQPLCGIDCWITGRNPGRLSPPVPAHLARLAGE